jgi:hypothetical protein
MCFMGEQVRFRSHSYRLSGGGAPAPGGGRDPFKIDRRTLLAVLRAWRWAPTWDASPGG